MKYSNSLVLVFCAILFSCGSNIDKTIHIETIGNQMKYTITEIQATAGSTIKIILKNNATLDIMKHNIVVLSKKSAINEVGIAALQAEDNVPDHPAIIAASQLTGPGETTELILKVPNKPGKYPYICTYPGHYSVMQGIIIVK